MLIVADFIAVFKKLCQLPEDGKIIASKHVAAVYRTEHLLVLLELLTA
jgi:hypothetical protein